MSRLRNVSRRSSPRIVRPARRDAQVAYVHQLAQRPTRSVIALDKRP